jgi:hypothetical protein
VIKSDSFRKKILKTFPIIIEGYFQLSFLLSFIDLIVSIFFIFLAIAFCGTFILYFENYVIRKDGSYIFSFQENV